jgi:hypothetical protein
MIPFLNNAPPRHPFYHNDRNNKNDDEMNNVHLDSPIFDYSK